MNQQSMNQSTKPTNNTTKALNTSRNTSQAVPTSTGYSGSKVIGIVIVVVVVILLAGASYWLYTFYSNRVFQTTVETEVMPDVKDAGAKFSAGSGSIPSSNYSNEYSISMWLNIDNYTYKYGQEKIVLRRGDAGSGNPEIVLDTKNNDLIVRLKLQSAPATSSLVLSGSSSTASVSRFEDVSKLGLQTHQYGNNELLDNAYKHGGVLPSGNSGVSNTLDRVGSNLVDYPTIQYQIAGGCDNALTTMSPDNAMTIMIEQAARMKEGFKNSGASAGAGMLDDGMARVDTQRLSDNSAPIESQHVYHDDYFAAISGNQVQSSKLNSMIRENFDVTSDLVNACTAVILDLCKLATILQSPSSADNQVANMNTAFQSLIDALETSRSTAKTADDITSVFDSSMSGVISNMSPISSVREVLEKLASDLTNLEAVSAQADANTISMTTIQNAVNSKLTSSNCSLTLTGTNEVNITANFYEGFISLLKKSLYAYINNMSHGIQKAYPELAGNQNASCLIQNATDSDPTVGTCVYRGIPLQRWVHVVVSVYNQVVDIFIDGQLASSCVLKAFPAISTSDVQITPDGGFAGKISRVTFSNTAMTVTHAKQLYYAGPVPSSSLWSMIPNWVWYVIIILIIVGIGYSLFV